MPGWYPIMLNVAGKLCVVVGGGPVAERKARGLLDAEARVRVVSPALTPGLSRLAADGLLEWRPKEAGPADWEGAVLGFAATDRPEANRRLAEAARQAGIWVNAADEGESGDFILPAVLRRGDLVLAACSSGASPALAARIVRELAERYGPEYGEYAALLRDIRAAAKSLVPDPERRRRMLAAASEERFLKEWLASDRAGDPRPAVESLLRQTGPDHEDKEKN